MRNQSPGPQQQPSRAQHYFVGLAIGFIPLLLALISFSNNATLLLIAALLYLTELVAAFICLAITPIRFVGYGLLTMMLIDPVVFYIACVVQISHP